MKNSSDNLQAKGAAAAPQGNAGPQLIDDLRLARERLMLYLELLHVPQQQADELAAEAIRRAEQRPSCEHPVTNALRALHALPVGNTMNVASMPPLNRGPMVSVEIDRQPWWTFFKKRILRKK
jgi:hypothetical protein